MITTTPASAPGMASATGTVNGSTDEPADRADELQALAIRWPQFSVQELRRLHFLVYRRRTGRLASPAPVDAQVEALCAALLRQPGVPTRPPHLPHVSGPGLPPLWVAWAARQQEQHGAPR